ncbi:mandelate racemase/muconate lactonizing enzyme family protein [Halorarum halophilum]|uniref:Mandelate racemase/muconate lactonizing enzyme family protein n=2 Tax=Halorarum halophilum TaxID=2743090 RepID=A0A7D5KVU2_9EURY|nr:mandelate racemase/muconate lactonizing enzyme family protein [Halobaculum halophilum]
MTGGVGWRDLRADGLRRDPERDVEITDVECVVVEGNFPWNLIKVSTDADEYGLGEAFPGPAGEYIEFLKPGLVGENPLDVDRLVEHMTQLVSGLGGSLGYSQAAVSGIEIALWDVAGKVLDVPVYQLLGGKYRDAVRIYADCHAGENLAAAAEADPRDIYTPESYADVAREVIDEGFDALKFDLDVKIEDADTATRRLSNGAIQHKIDVVDAVREEVGYDPTLGFDLHWNFTVETATKLARGVEEYDLDWIEDPVPPENVDAHRKVTESTSTPVLAGENLTRVEGFLPFLTEQAVDVVAPDIQKCGGLLELRKIATVADAFDVPVAPHNISSPVGTMASVHACATVPNAFALEWHAREVDWWDDLHTGDPLIVGGEIQVPEEPGIGIDLDAEVVTEHAAPGEDVFDLD